MIFMREHIRHGFGFAIGMCLGYAIMGFVKDSILKLGSKGEKTEEQE